MSCCSRPRRTRPPTPCASAQIEVVISKNEAEMQKHPNSFDFILDTVSADHDLDAYLNLLKLDGTMTLVGAPANAADVPVGQACCSAAEASPVPSSAESAKPRKCSISAPSTASPSDIEMIGIQQINEAYERLLKSDVKYRFVIDMASLK